jgi:hypothetical protein
VTTIGGRTGDTMARTLLWLLLAVALVSCGGTSGGLPDVRLDLTVEPDPPQVGPATVIVTLQNAEGQPIAGAEVELEGNMSHAGMVPVFATAYEVAPGRYEAALELTMGGDWFILVDAALPDGRTLERKVDVPGVKVP